MEKSTPGIYFRIDWLSLIFEGWSIRQIASYYRIDEAFPSYLENGFVTNIGGMMYFAYDWNGIKFFVKSSDLQSVPEDVLHSVGIFDVVFSKIKFDLSGQALEFLRANYFEGCENGKEGLVLDDYIRIRPDSCNCTRCDFAFDYVDYKPQLFDKMIRFIKDQADEGRTLILCKGLQGGLSYSYRLGDQSTLYLGSTGCDKLLRVYDKRRQFYDPNKNCWKVPEDKLLYGKVDSWNRIEFQVRRKAAEQILYQPYDDLTDFSEMVLMMIYERYAFRDPSIGPHSKDCKVLDFWTELAPDWQTYHSIIQNLHYAEPAPYIERAKKYIETVAFRPILTYMATYGVGAFISYIDSILKKIQESVDSPDPIISFEAQLRRAGIYSALSQGGIPNIEDFPGLKKNGDGSISLNINYL